MKKTSLLLFLIAALLPTIGSAQNNRKAVKEMIDKLLRYEVEIDFKKTPYLTIGVLMADSTYTFHYKTSSDDKQTATQNDSTLFEIGSVTKVFTASLLAQAVSEGKIKLTDTVERFLPVGYKLPLYNDKPIRFIDLATHTAGLPKFPYNIGNKEDGFNNLYKNYTSDDERQFLANYRLRTAPFDKYSYSHLGYDILAQALVTIYKTSNYEALLVQKIAKPLTLKDTRIVLDSLQKKRLAQGHSMIGEPVKPWEFRSFEGSLGLKSSIVDMLHWIRLQFDTPTTWQAAFTLARSPQHKADKNGVMSSLGWHNVTILKRFPSVIVHSGATDGFRCYTAFVPETRTGVVIMTNSERPLEGLGGLILQMLNYNWKLPKKNK
jgi:serine-type D-Ala-D-Ala carboxypeptidase/endopeptidase